MTDITTNEAKQYEETTKRELGGLRSIRSIGRLIDWFDRFDRFDIGKNAKMKMPLLKELSRTSQDSFESESDSK